MIDDRASTQSPSDPTSDDPAKNDPNSGEFTFAMGEFSAVFPRDRSYATNHMWAQQIDSRGSAEASPRERVWRFGLTAYAVRLLQDVYFLDWLVSQGQSLSYRQTLGSIESKKAESDLFSPIAGKLSAINADALSDPSIINAAPYSDGWLIEIAAATDASEKLLTPDGYAAHLVEAWDVAQRTIKGQANE